LEVVKTFGVKLVETKLPELPYGPVTGTVIAAEGASVFQPLIESGKVDLLADKRQIAGLKTALQIPACDYLKAMRIRRVIQLAFRKMFTEVDVLLAPARYGVASKIDETFDRGGTTPRPAAPGQNPRPTGMRALIPAGNLAGLPAISLPCGIVSGLPIAIQFVGRPFTENLLLSIGREFQQQTDWHKKRPSVS
jgi:aspartyl-tRNA(Asn)/glutamyl-tRNA(Gln) amidotransferase subunit A